MLDDRFSGGARYDFSALNVLVVDDRMTMVRLLRAMLRGIGITEVREAHSGKEALEVLADFDADIVLTDSEMAPMNGLELARELRMGKNSPNPYISIIMITGKTEREHVLAARDVGINHVLSKPISPKSLTDRIVALIDDPAPFVRTESYFGPNRRHRTVELPEGVADRRKPRPEDSSEPSMAARRSNRRSLAGC